MLLKGADGSALPQQQLSLVVSQQGKESRQTFLTDSLGKAPFELETAEWQGVVSLRVSDPFPSPWHRVHPRSTGLGTPPSPELASVVPSDGTSTSWTAGQLHHPGF